MEKTEQLKRIRKFTRIMEKSIWDLSTNSPGKISHILPEVTNKFVEYIDVILYISDEYLDYDGLDVYAVFGTNKINDENIRRFFVPKFVIEGEYDDIEKDTKNLLNSMYDTGVTNSINEELDKINKSMANVQLLRNYNFRL